MPSSAEAVCASSARIEIRLETSPLWFPDPLEMAEFGQIHFRAIVWGVLLSLFLWTSAFFAGRALWDLWR